MDPLPGADELTSAEFTSLLPIAPGFIGGSTIAKAPQTQLIELGLIQKRMGGFMATPAARTVARIQIGR